MVSTCQAVAAEGTGHRERNLFIAKRFDDEARRLEALDGGTVLLRENLPVAPRDLNRGARPVTRQGDHSRACRREGEDRRRQSEGRKVPGRSRGGNGVGLREGQQDQGRGEDAHRDGDGDGSVRVRGEGVAQAGKCRWLALSAPNQPRRTWGRRLAGPVEEQDRPPACVPHLAGMAGRVTILSARAVQIPPGANRRSRESAPTAFRPCRGRLSRLRPTKPWRNRGLFNQRFRGTAGRTRPDTGRC